MNHIVLIGHGKMGSALAKGWVKENSKYKISIIEKEELLLNYKKFTKILMNFLQKIKKLILLFLL